MCRYTFFVHAWFAPIFSPHPVPLLHDEVNMNMYILTSFTRGLRILPVDELQRFLSAARLNSQMDGARVGRSGRDGYKRRVLTWAWGLV